MHRTKTLLATPRWQRATLWLTSLLLGATLAVGTGCSGGGESTGPDNDDITGTYVLQNVDEESLPVEIHHGPWFDAASGTFFNQFIFTVTGGSIQLLDGGRFTMTMSAVVNGDGQGGAATLSVDGWYEVDGDEIWFEADDETWGSVTATLDGDTIIMSADMMNKGDSRDFSYQR
jgi:hypothetical protein